MVAPIVLMGAMAGLSLIQGLGQQGQAKRAQIAAKSDARVANILRKAQNQIQGATTSLSRYMQSRQNQELLRTGGEALDTTTTNILRLHEASVTGSLSRRIQAAEDAGSLYASRAAAGIGGGTSEMLRATQELRVAQIEQGITRQEEQQEFGLEQQRRQQLDSMVLGLDLSPIVAGINYVPTQAQKVEVPSTAEVIGRAGLQFAQAYAMFGGAASGASQVNLQGQATPLTNNPAFVRNM
jgi:hypothetical protein